MLSKSVTTNIDKSYSNIRDVGTESIPFHNEKSNLDLKVTWNEEGNTNNIYSDCLEGDYSTLLIHDPDNV